MLEPAPSEGPHVSEVQNKITAYLPDFEYEDKPQI
jgi:hypothetical protein